MDPSFDLPDSTDWLDTPLTLLAPLESALRCQVCKDFFDNPVITSCSHTFCSLCIRRCLNSEGKCPVCRSSDQETKLRRNWTVQELVEAFNNARPSVLGLARKARDGAVVERGHEESEFGVHVLKKRRIEVESEGVSDAATAAGAEGVLTRSQNRGSQNHSHPATVDLVADSQDEDDVPDDGLVACPICNRRMKNEAVFPHLDTCNGASSPPREVSFGSLQPISPRKAKPTPTKQTERLPAINYSILKDGVLRKKMKDLGIPSWGPRPLLQRRHTEWMNLWNANCDSISPKSKRELLYELDAWERTQGGHANALSFDSTNSVMGKDFDAAAWSTNHGDDFKKLIANARKKSDAVHKPDSEVLAASNKLEMAPIPEQVERSTAAHAPEPGASYANDSVNGVENQVQPTQNGEINVPPGLS